MRKNVLGITAIFAYLWTAAGAQGRAPSTVVLTSSPNYSVFGSPVTLVAAVTPSSTTGTVTFYDGTAVLGVSPVSGGQATLQTWLLPFGQRVLRAYYGGDSNDGPAISATLLQSVKTAAGGQFQPAVSYPAGAGADGVAVGDFNNDGKADLVVVDGNGVSILLGNGDGTLQPALDNATGNNASSAAVGDFNGDGAADLAVVNQGDQNVSVLLGNGDGTFHAPVNYPVGSGLPGAVAVGDVNGDGRADLVTAAMDTRVLLGNGDGTFQAAASLGVGRAQFAALGDFNADGNADLALVNSSNNGVAVALGNGDGTFATPVIYLTNEGSGTISDPGSVTVADLNGDGTPDLTVANFYSGYASALLGNGDGTFQAAMNFSSGHGLSSAAVSDFNGDGKADVALSYAGFASEGIPGSVNVFLGNGDGTFTALDTYPESGSSDMLATAITTADFNGDGIADLVSTLAGGSGVELIAGAAAAPSLFVQVAPRGTFLQGQTGAVYTITVSNMGASPTSGVVTVTDAVPPGFTVTAMSGVGWMCVPAVLTCSRQDSLAAFSSYPPVTVTGNIAAGTQGAAINSASASGGGSAGTGAVAYPATIYTAAQLAQTWLRMAEPPSFAAGAELLMTDGTVLVQQFCTNHWYKLTPDLFGNYANGTWSQAASMPPGYGPAGYSSAVLADGRVVAIGGEFIAPHCVLSGAAESKLGAIYDPVADQWTALAAPDGWRGVGDAPNTVLPNGHFLLSDIFSTQLADLDPSTLTWTVLPGAGKQDAGEEEGFTLLPDGSVLTVDTETVPQAERYNPSAQTWVSAGATATPLASPAVEIGPQVLRPDGTVFVAGATGHTGIYDTKSGTWSAGPDFPQSSGGPLVSIDAPGALLPNGNVLVAATLSGPSGLGNAGTPTYFEFDGSNLNPVPAPPGGPAPIASYLLVLPSGQVMYSGEIFAPTGGAAIYNPGGSANPAWAPAIANAPGAVQAGQTYSISGTQFNGLSQAVGFGDDFQAATNYPLVRIVNSATGHVFYCRTHNHSTMAVATGSAIVSTQFDVPASIEAGPATLFVVANGIPSAPWNVTVAVSPTIGNIEGGGLSTPPVTAISSNGYFTIFGAMFANTGVQSVLQPSDLVNGSLPQNLGSTCVNVGSQRAYPTFVSAAQINAIAPELPASGTVAVSVVANCGGPNETVSPAVNVTVAAATPELLTWVQNANGRNPVVAVDGVSGVYIAPPGVIPSVTFRAAQPGEVLTIYGIGFGATANGPQPGALPPARDSVASYSVTLGGAPISASYAGVTPGSAGLYQVNLTVPAGLPAGNYPIELTVNGVESPVGAFLAVGP